MMLGQGYPDDAVGETAPPIAPLLPHFQRQLKSEKDRIPLRSAVVTQRHSSIHPSHPIQVVPEKLLPAKREQRKARKVN